MAECPNLQKCGFCKKYNRSKSLAVQGFINLYCKTEKQNECKRKAFKEKNGTLPADNMMPNGAFIKE